MSHNWYNIKGLSLIKLPLNNENVLYDGCISETVYKITKVSGSYNKSSDVNA